jgi:hypothetical protein
VTKEIQNQSQDEDYADENDSGNRVSSKSSDGTQSEGEADEKNCLKTFMHDVRIRIRGAKTNTEDTHLQKKLPQNLHA